MKNKQSPLLFPFRYGKLFHSLSWIWPLLETALYYATFLLEENKFASLCCHGPKDSPTMVLVSIVPLLLKIIFGTVFLSIGIAAGFRVKKLLPPEHIQSLQRIMLKILVFSLIYSLCQLIVILFSLHGILNQSDVLSNWTSIVTLVPGSISVGWVISRKSIKSLSEINLKSCPLQGTPAVNYEDFFAQLGHPWIKSIQETTKVSNNNDHIRTLRQDGTVETNDIFMQL